MKGYFLITIFAFSITSCVKKDYEIAYDRCVERADQNIDTKDLQGVPGGGFIGGALKGLGTDITESLKKGCDELKSQCEKDEEGMLCQGFIGEFKE